MAERKRKVINCSVLQYICHIEWGTLIVYIYILFIHDPLFDHRICDLVLYTHIKHTHTRGGTFIRFALTKRSSSLATIVVKINDGPEFDRIYIHIQIVENDT